MIGRTAGHTILLMIRILCTGEEAKAIVDYAAS